MLARNLYQVSGLRELIIVGYHNQLWGIRSDPLGFDKNWSDQDPVA